MRIQRIQYVYNAYMKIRSSTCIADTAAAADGDDDAAVVVKNLFRF